MRNIRKLINLVEICKADNTKIQSSNALCINKNLDYERKIN